MAVVAAIGRGRYKEMVRAMEQANLEPIVIEDLVKFGQDQGFEQGLERGREEGLERGREEGSIANARSSLLEVFEARGITLGADERARIDAEPSLDRLRAWFRRALTAASAAEALSDEPR